MINDTTGIWFEESMSLLELFTEIWAGVTSQSIDHSKASVSLKAHSSLGDGPMKTATLELTKPLPGSSSAHRRVNGGDPIATLEESRLSLKRDGGHSIWCFLHPGSKMWSPLLFPPAGRTDLVSKTQTS